MGRDRNRFRKAKFYTSRGRAYPDGKGTARWDPPLDCNQLVWGRPECAFGKRMRLTDAIVFDRVP